MNTDSDLRSPAGWGRLCDCGCGTAPGRRLFTRALLASGAVAALPVLARDGVDVGSQSAMARLVPAEQVEQAATQQYAQLLREARNKNALGPDSHPQVQRLRAIAQRLIPYCEPWNAR